MKTPHIISREDNKDGNFHFEVEFNCPTDELLSRNEIAEKLSAYVFDRLIIEDTPKDKYRISVRV